MNASSCVLVAGEVKPPAGSRRPSSLLDRGYLQILGVTLAKHCWPRPIVWREVAQALAYDAPWSPSPRVPILCRPGWPPI